MKKRLVVGLAVVVLLGLGAIVLFERSGKGPAVSVDAVLAERGPPPSPPVALRKTTPVALGATAPPGPSLPERVAEVPWEDVEEVYSGRPSDSPWSEAIMALAEQLRGAIQPCSEEQARRFAGGVVDPGESSSPSMLKLRLEALAPDRLAVIGVEPGYVGRSPSEYVRCVIRVIDRYEVPATGIRAGQRLKTILQIY